MTSSHSTPTLLQLPREIRNNIYTRLFPKAAILIYPSYSDKDKFILRPDSAYSSPLLITCKQVHQEYLEVLSSDGALFLQDFAEMTDVSKHLSPTILNLTQRITRIGDLSSLPDLKPFANLREVTLGSFDSARTFRSEDDSILRQYIEKSIDLLTISTYGKPVSICNYQPSQHKHSRDWKTVWESQLSKHFAVKDRKYMFHAMINVTIELLVPGSGSTRGRKCKIFMSVQYNIDLDKSVERRYWDTMDREIDRDEVYKLARDFFEMPVAQSAVKVLADDDDDDDDNQSSDDDHEEDDDDVL